MYLNPSKEINPKMLNEINKWGGQKQVKES